MVFDACATFGRNFSDLAILGCKPSDVTLVAFNAIEKVFAESTIKSSLSHSLPNKYPEFIKTLRVGTQVKKSCKRFSFSGFS